MVKVRRAPRPTRRPREPGATTENIGQYLKKEQRRSRGCIVGRMPADFHHGLLGPVCLQSHAGTLACIEASPPKVGQVELMLSKLILERRVFVL